MSNVLTFYRILDDGDLVRLGCNSTIPQTGWLINNNSLFLTVLGLSKIMTLAGSMSGKEPLPRLLPSCCVLAWWMEMVRRFS